MQPYEKLGNFRLKQHTNFIHQTIYIYSSDNTYS